MEHCNIRDQANNCLRGFNLLLELGVGAAGDGKATKNGYDIAAIEDQLARFRMWAGNIGVFAGGSASVDHRLRKNEEAGKLMFEFLQTLHEFIREGESTFLRYYVCITQPHRAPWHLHGYLNTILNFSTTTMPNC
jgi:hypothetical protein